MATPSAKDLDHSAALRANGRLNGHRSARELVDLIVEHASRPIEEAQSLPAEYYTSEALYELEVERIFKRDWLYICRTDEVENPGDWYAAEIAGQPIMLVRGKDMQVRALSRVCPHRFMDILSAERQEGRDHGHKDSFVCPYHSWAFNTEGGLSGAPLMNRSELFQRERESYCLASYPTEVWHGFVFVNLDPDAEPLTPRFDEMEEVLAPYRLEEWKVVDRIDWPESPVTWKLAMDNGRECYHHQGTHSESVEPLWPAHLVDADGTDSEYFYYQRMYVDPKAAIAEEDGHPIQPVVVPPLDGLTPYQRSHSLLVGVYPTMWFSPGPDVLLVAKWWPTGPQAHKFDLALCIHPSRLDHPDLEKIKAETREWLVQIQNEDSAMVTGIQSMLGSDQAKRGGGALSHLEKPLWTFQKYMAKRLAGADV